VTTAVLSFGLHAVALAVHLVSSGPGAPAPAAPVAMPGEQVVYVSIVTEPPVLDVPPGADTAAPMDAGEFEDIVVPDPVPPREEQPVVADAPSPDTDISTEPETLPETPSPMLSALKMPKKPAPPLQVKKAAAPPKALPPTPVAAHTAPAVARPRQRPATPPAAHGSIAHTASTAPLRTRATFPRYLRNPPPAYPKAELRRRREGLVILNVEVGADGRARAVSVHQSSGIVAFDRAARDAVMRWRFIPATFDGRPVDGTAQVPVRFAMTQ